MFSQKVTENLKRSSYIRAMFEEGLKLRKKYGPDKVFDFTLGNPDPEPPDEVIETARTLLNNGKPGLHSYMANAGFQDVCGKIAVHISKETGLDLQSDNIVMSCGAAGGLNVVLKSLLNPGDEVIVFAPFFFEYAFYIDNHGGKCIICETNKATFEPDPESLRNTITPKTKAIIINSPNNPTGVVYSNENLQKIADVLNQKEEEYGTEIYVISDEPYTKLVYDNVELPSVLKIFKNSIVVNSFSKSHSLPGERIGYIAVNPAIKDSEILINALVFCTRTLGYVNAPSMFQKVVAENLDKCVDTRLYSDRRDILYNHLIKCGFECRKPQGAFYLFPKSPIPDDEEFKNLALKYNILIVPGKGFACPGYFRMAYCVSQGIIRNSLPAFEALAKELKLI
jgi:aspartate aminotransferase